MQISHYLLRTPLFLTMDCENWKRVQHGVRHNM